MFRVGLRTIPRLIKPIIYVKPHNISIRTIKTASTQIAKKPTRLINFTPEHYKNNISINKNVNHKNNIYVKSFGYLFGSSTYFVSHIFTNNFDILSLHLLFYCFCGAGYIYAKKNNIQFLSDTTEGFLIFPFFLFIAKNLYLKIEYYI